jgi:hypothetical protein
MGNNSSSSINKIASQEKYVSDNLSKVRYNCNCQGMESKYSNRQLRNKLREDYYSSYRSSLSNNYVLSNDWEKIKGSSK